MATLEEKVLENRDKIAFSNYLPYEKVLDVVMIEVNDADTTLSAGGTYDGMVSIPNPLGYTALPSAFVEWIYNGGTGETYTEDDIRRIPRQVPITYGFSFQFTPTVTDTTIRLYYTNTTNYGSVYRVYIYLLEM